METKKAWCVKTHIVDDCVTMNDDVRVFKYLEEGEKAFNEIVEEERKVANDNEYVIEYDDSRYFEAYEDGYFAHNHICVSLFQIVIE